MMILSRSLQQADTKNLLNELSAIFANNTWIVFQPQFLQLGSEAEHEAREIRLNSGESAYRLLAKKCMN